MKTDPRWTVKQTAEAEVLQLAQVYYVLKNAPFLRTWRAVGVDAFNANQDTHDRLQRFQQSAVQCRLP